MISPAELTAMAGNTESAADRDKLIFPGREKFKRKAKNSMKRKIFFMMIFWLKAIPFIFLYPEEKFVLYKPNGATFIPHQSYLIFAIPLVYTKKRSTGQSPLGVIFAFTSYGDSGNMGTSYGGCSSK
jgi:hypothetical protein